MTPAPRTARSLDEALGQALEDLEAGLTPQQVLNRYPLYEAELGPLLETAYRLRLTRWPTLSMAARVSGRERMHAALAQQKGRRRFIIAPVWRQLGAGLALALLAGTTYVASPISPLRSMNRPRLTGAVPVTITATWTVAPSATTKLPATVAVLATRGPAATVNIMEIVEATEAADPELGLKHTAASATPTSRPSPTPTRATRTRVPTSTWTPTPRAIASSVTTTARPAAVTVAAPGASAPSATAAVASPSPATTPSVVASATSVRATPVKTTTSLPTEGPEEPATATPRPKATGTPEPPAPKPTDEPTSPGGGQPETPEPTDSHHSDETPQAPKTPKPENIRPAAIMQILVQQARDEAKPPGQVVREAVQERPRPEPPRGKNSKR